MPSDRELDQLIDAALSSYSAKEAHPRLEQRILAKALTERPRKKRFAWALALAIPAAACLLLFLFFAVRHSSRPKTLQAKATVAPAPTATNTQEIPVANSVQLARKISTQHKGTTRPTSLSPRETLPKQDVFPSPSPLTDEERAVVARLRMPAQMSRQADTTVAVEAVEISPIHIAELQIKAIAPSHDRPTSLPLDSLPKIQQP